MIFPLNRSVQLARIAVVLFLSISLCHASLAQSDEATHTVTIKVEEVTRLEFAERSSVTVKPGETQTVETVYSITKNTPDPRSIEAKVSLEGDSLRGATIAAIMDAPETSGNSTGVKEILSDGTVQAQTLVEDLTSANASGVGAAFDITVPPSAMPGKHSLTVTYTIVDE